MTIISIVAKSSLSSDTALFLGCCIFLIVMGVFFVFFWYDPKMSDKEDIFWANKKLKYGGIFFILIGFYGVAKVIFGW
jgi:hypothetical protein